MNFQGGTTIKIDAKGRISFPTKYRDALLSAENGELTLTPNLDGGLYIYPRTKWIKFRDALMALPMTKDRLRRFFLGHASDVVLDKSGRILVSPDLREVAKLESNVLLLGLGDYFELWDKATYELSQADEDLHSMLSALDGIL